MAALLALEDASGFQCSNALWLVLAKFAAAFAEDVVLIPTTGKLGRSSGRAYLSEVAAPRQCNQSARARLDEHVIHVLTARR